MLGELRADVDQVVGYDAGLRLEGGPIITSIS